MRFPVFSHSISSTSSQAARPMVKDGNRMWEGGGRGNRVVEECVEGDREAREQQGIEFRHPVRLQLQAPLPGDSRILRKLSAMRLWRIVAVRPHAWSAANGCKR